MQGLISIFLVGIMTIYAPLTVLASNIDVFTDGTEIEMSENENLQEIFNSGEEDADEYEVVQETPKDDELENIDCEEMENIPENFEKPSKIEDTFEAFVGTAENLIIGNYECAVNGNELTITKYTGTDTSITVPQFLGEYEVTAIGSYAFANCSHLKSITLPEGLKSIGYSFISGTSVTNLTIPKTVTWGGHGGYHSDTGVIGGAKMLKSISFEEGIKKIPDYFCSDSSENDVLVKVEIPESVSEIGYQAFYNCSAITI